MPLYDFICHTCYVEQVVNGSMKNPPQPPFCDDCGQFMGRRYNSRTYVFKPFVEQHAFTTPVEFQSKAQRDAAMNEAGLTYDSKKYIGKPKKKWAADSITPEIVKDAIDRSKSSDKSRVLEGLTNDNPSYSSTII